jgi:hypothetical protein
MSQLPEAFDNKTDKQPADFASVASPEDYQQLLLAYQRIRQERDILHRALMAFRLSKTHRRSSHLSHTD